MASTNKTPNYNLSQFQPTNKLERTDYNSDMDKIDTELKKHETNIGLLNQGFVYKGVLETVDANTLDTGWWSVSVVNFNDLHYPARYGIIQSIKIGTSYVAQVFYAFNSTNNFYVRTSPNGGALWYGWDAK